MIDYSYYVLILHVVSEHIVDWIYDSPMVFPNFDKP